MNDFEWLTLQRSVVRQDLHRATREVIQRAPAAALRFVEDRPGLSMAISAGAGFAAGFATVRALGASDPPPANEEGMGRVPHDPLGWIQSATGALRAFVSTAALVKTLGSELASPAESPAQKLAT